jgi:hypothetical protein
MLIPNKFNGYQAGRRTYNTGMEPLLIGAAIGGGSAALQGGDPLKGALLGGLTGGVGSGIAGALAGSAGAGAAGAGAAELASVGATDAASGLLGSPGAFSTPISVGDITARALPAFDQGAVQAGLGIGPSGAESLVGVPSGDFLREVANSAAPFEAGYYNLGPAAESVATQAAPEVAQAATAQGGVASLPAAQPLSVMGQQASPNLAFDTPRLTQATSSAKQGLAEMWEKLPLSKKVLYGGTGALLLPSLLSGKNKVPAQAPYTGPLSRFRFNPDTYQAATIPTRMARGGIADLGSYSDGGRLLKGPGDGMSDHIPATISNKRPARLADGEFVIPADVVSHLGNGSTDAGAKQLYAMMDRVRKARTGRKAQGKQIRPQKLMVA